jgi:fatty-acyl-CoA synthase
MLAAADNVADRLGLDADDRTYGYLPLFFNGGLVGVSLATLSRGGAVILQETFEPADTLRLLERHGCTTMFAWPHQVDALTQLPHFDRAKLRIRKGPGANARWAPALFPADHQAVGTWGMTETGPMASSTRFDDPLEVRAGAHGRPMPGLEMRIVEPGSNRPLAAGQEGEIVVRGSSVMRTYYRTAPADCFDAEGFFHTGDSGSIDDAGLLHFTGRLVDVIKTAGVSVASAEVEATLMMHPTVKAAYVVPVPHPSRGENVAAFIVPAHGTCETDTLLAHCRAQLATYKVPRFLFLVTEGDLPSLGSGKVDRRQLRERAAVLAAQVPHSA